MDRESALNIVQKTEMLARLLDGNDIYTFFSLYSLSFDEFIFTHEACWVCCICPNFVVDLDEPLHYNSGNFTTGQSILQTISEEDGKGKGFAKFVGTRRRTGSLINILSTLPFFNHFL